MIQPLLINFKKYVIASVARQSRSLQG